MSFPSRGKHLLVACVTFSFVTACGNATGPVDDWGFGIAGRWSGETSSTSLVVDFGQIQKTCQQGYMGSYSCQGVASLTGSIRTAHGQSAIRGAVYVGEGTDAAVAVYIVAVNPLDQGPGGCSIDRYDYYAWPSQGAMVGDVAIYCSSAGLQPENPTRHSESLRLKRS